MTNRPNYYRNGKPLVGYRRITAARVPVTRSLNVTPIEAGLIVTLLGIAAILGWSIAAAGFNLPGLG